MYEQELREAHTLIEQGRITEARKLLQTLDDPTARQWLVQLTATKHDFKRRSAIPLPLLIAIATVIFVGALIVMLLLTPTLLNRLRNPPTNTPALQEEQLYNNLIQLCQAALSSSDQEPCTTWANAVFTNYHPAALACVAEYGVDTPENRTKTSQCLDTNSVPPPA